MWAKRCHSYRPHASKLRRDSLGVCNVRYYVERYTYMYMYIDVYIIDRSR